MELTFRNVDACSGLFDLKAPVLDDDTVDTIVRRLQRLSRSAKGKY